MALTNRRLMISRLILLAAFLVTLATLIIMNMQTAGHIILAVLGFSAVVFIHECGHFFVAKACNIKVEVFSIFIRCGYFVLEIPSCRDFVVIY